MAQITLRLDDDLADAIRDEAARRNRSVNAWLQELARAVVDPASSGDEVERLRERLGRAGLLIEFDGYPADEPGPDPDAVAAARAEAGRGRPLSSFVSEGRD